VPLELGKILQAKALSDGPLGIADASDLRNRVAKAGNVGRGNEEASTLRHRSMVTSISAIV
jgi:hypothetical protein